MEIETLIVNQPRPGDLPPNWIVVEAPRPMWGHACCKSIWHRVGVNPAEPDAREMLEWNAEMKGTVLLFATEELLAPMMAEGREQAGSFEEWGVTDEEIRQHVIDNLYMTRTMVSVDALLQEATHDD